MYVFLCDSSLQDMADHGYTKLPISCSSCSPVTPSIQRSFPGHIPVIFVVPCLHLSLLQPICLLRIRFSKTSFIIMQLRNFSSLSPILSISVLFVDIFFQTFELITRSFHGILSIFVERLPSIHCHIRFWISHGISGIFSLFLKKVFLFLNTFLSFWNALFANQMRLWILMSHFQTSVKTFPSYLNFYTCLMLKSSVCHSHLEGLSDADHHTFYLLIVHFSRFLLLICLGDSVVHFLSCKPSIQRHLCILYR